MDLDGTTLGPDNDTASVKGGFHRRGQSENPNYPAISASPTTGTATSKAAAGTAITATSAATPPVSRPSRKHTRGQSIDESGSPLPTPGRSPRTRKPTGESPISGSATISGNGTISRRRTKLSPAMFDPAGGESSSPSSPNLTPSAPGNKSGTGGSPGSPGLHLPSHSPGGLERFRAEIEALRATAPDNWLKVLSQKHFGGDSPREGSRGASPDREGGEHSKRRRHWRGVTEF